MRLGKLLKIAVEVIEVISSDDKESSKLTDIEKAIAAIKDSKKVKIETSND